MKASTSRFADKGDNMSFLEKLPFFKKKEVEVDDLDERFEDVVSEIQKIDDMNDPKKIEQYILDSCEQVISLTKEAEAEKSQVRLLNNYISDIDTISSLPNDKRKELSDTAEIIVKKDRATKNYQSSEKKISDEDYLLMMENEDDMPNEIIKMQKNELYVDKMKHSLNAIEGEHSEAKIDLDESKQNQKFLKNISIAFFVLYMSGLILVLILKMYVGINMNTAFLVYLLFGAVAIFIIYTIQVNNEKKRKKSIKYLNSMTTLLNTTRMKYAAGVNALEYEKNSFSVANSYELNYKWESYLEAVRERDRFLSDNEDLSYYSGKLIKLLKRLNLHDEKVWLKQVEALINEDDMKKIRQRLVKRKNIIESEIEKITKEILAERNEINSLMKEHDFYVPEILEIISSVDKLCGLNMARRKKGNT